MPWPNRFMYIAAGVAVFILLAGVIWLLVNVNDWSRDLTTNHAATSETAANPSLRPIQAELSRNELTALVISAAGGIPGWEFAGSQESTEDVTLRFVRTTRLMKFKDDITVHIRAVTDGGQKPRFEITAESRSRVGKGDFGQNPRNLAEILDKVRLLLR